MMGCGHKKLLLVGPTKNYIECDLFIRGDGQKTYAQLGKGCHNFCLLNEFEARGSVGIRMQICSLQ